MLVSVAIPGFKDGIFKFRIILVKHLVQNVVVLVFLILALIKCEKFSIVDERSQVDENIAIGMIVVIVIGIGVEFMYFLGILLVALASMCKGKNRDRENQVAPS